MPQVIVNKKVAGKEALDTLPLIPSPQGRGNKMVNLHQGRENTPLHPSQVGIFPLPWRERVRVRGMWNKQQ
jgi:hypothetical protein